MSEEENSIEPGEEELEAMFAEAAERERQHSGEGAEVQDPTPERIEDEVVNVEADASQSVGLEEAILNAVELAHEAADLANDATEMASHSTEEARELVQEAMDEIKSMAESQSVSLMVSGEMEEYLTALKSNSDAIRQRTEQLRERVKGLSR